MKFGKLAAVVAAVSLAAAPVAARLYNAVQGSSAAAGVAAAYAPPERLEGENGILIALLAGTAIYSGLVVIVGDGDPITD